ncbi:MAG: UDP-N-acetylmuramoyl-L-alanyl-D-glutamate--2,6-diaminopimelate ligase [Patescibacteria group bacterium]|nr:UDP-N-acetylmuramoyl-L-alanyl-D-glutamate--2,6-diaminopimelate ligase [Patescibacteria group bacterium]
MKKILRFFEKFIPKPLYQIGQPIYHYILAFAAVLFYGFPSRKMTVIGVTGTKGKTTTCNLITHILNSAGFKTGMSTTVNFRIGDKEWKNNLKQTMPGRFQLQSLLSKMAKEKCRYAVIETSSEGIAQFRHRFIDYDIGVFINLTPEHLERHKGFENYRNAKVSLFKQIAGKKHGVGIYNLDDENISYFLKPAVKKKYGYTIESKENLVSAVLKADEIELESNKTKFKIGDVQYETLLIGKFNIMNSLAAITAAVSQGIPADKIKSSLASFKPVSGRMEIINEGQNFSVIVDYAHEPASLEAVYSAIQETNLKRKDAKMICLLGAAGGGRDRWKRPVMGEIAGKYCNEIILTNEDPYDENPFEIISDIEKGITKTSFSPNNFYEIINRREAIEKAVSLAKKGDAVVLTGKGGEVWMCVEEGKKIPWNEKEIAEEIIENALKNSKH